MTDERVLGNAVNVLLPLFRPAGFKRRRYSVVDIANSVVYACTGGTSITQTTCCSILVSTPSRRDVQYHISKIDISWIQSAVNNRVVLQARAKDVLQQCAVNIAIDMTDTPPPTTGSRRTKAMSGADQPKAVYTTHFFFTHASAYVRLHGRRFTLAMKYVRADESLVDVVRYLLAEVQKTGIRIKCLFLDKGFFTAAAVMSYLNSVRIPYIIAAFPRGRKTGGRLSKLTRKRRDSFVVPDYEIIDSNTGEKCTFRLYAWQSTVRSGTGRRRITASSTCSMPQAV
ncbi:putative transposase [Candidatus Nitrososphaera gargensis Ga9.2]|uniref:Putative transposase n=1 Tax=Nitrososphaera gargensis (strain Ga9.2) TaxID=1237085 RepID=K0IDY9_NITGG|nr:hypothetical protein [Candidatus Nitrososphaera gargensis]AFU57038.1 putative transposase [Candidatus Nitrososphaera gargensis Ga9.2]